MRGIEQNESVLQTTNRPLCHFAAIKKSVHKYLENASNHWFMDANFWTSKHWNIHPNKLKKQNLIFKLFAPFPKTFQRRRWRVKNSDETDKLSAKNMLLTLKSEKMKFGMRESKHAMMFGGTSSLKKKRICSKFYIMVKRMLRYFPWVKMNALLYCVLHEAENNFEECCVTPHYSV